MKILLTGATGFLGSHIAENLISHNVELVLTKRKSSSLENCQSFIRHVDWVETDSAFWVEKIIEYKPDIIVHAAWNGVLSIKREDWESQLTNIDFMYQLLRIAKKSCIKKFISFGSQAEYGQMDGKISEEYRLKPTTSYGAIKLAVSELLRAFCTEQKINWYWLRLFSIFGERENENWLIPSAINKMLSESNEMDLTLCEQKYAYLYVKDFADAITNVVTIDAISGIYNISSNYPITLKDLLLLIRKNANPEFQLNFGALPYRLNQSMHIEGDSSKFINAFGQINTSDFNNKIEHVINTYKNS